MKRYILALLLALMLSVNAHAAPGTAQTDSRVTWFHCTMVSTATALTEITGCAAVSGSRYYITSITWSSSIISTTANYFLLRSGTGTDCATSTTSLFADFTTAAFGGRNSVFPTPIRSTVSHALCFIHAGAGTRNVNITGYLAP